MDEMYLDGDYLEEDLGGYASVCEGAYEDPIGGGQHLERKSHFCYVHVHTEYLDFLQSVALKEKELPLTIKSLYLSNLLTDNFEYNGIPKNDEKEAEYVRKYGDPYSAMSAQDVFMILSDSYPALRSVTIGGKHSGVLRWVKSDDRTGWLYDTTFNLMEYQRVFFDTPYNDYNPWENSESEGDLGIF
ncbi:hypothetical protein CPB84DRAFT_1775329 [Gymnopilus junonius]|uniref:Uncharacterized protein n=1 Tax=Gymnopilus junonius TaxID=109634 RepID=A0A9P5TPG6_GYMJU|nr:hypothetical protein CPB84DRAFT_1775329 [Gymnopilus junonius]